MPTRTPQGPLPLDATPPARPDPALRRRDRALLAVLTACSAALTLPAFEPGVLADNDFVAHAAYAEYLATQFRPETGGHLGWTPLFGTGQPFLLFNTPPLTYVAANVGYALGLDTTLTLKILLVSALLSIPLLGYALVRHATRDEPALGNAPIAAAACLALFSSELFGLDFFLNNGMINAALALPFLLTTTLAVWRAIDAPLASALRWGVVAAVAFAATALTHVTTAYMAGLFAAAVWVFQPRPGLVSAGVRTAAIFALGLGVCAYWWIPSLEVAEHAASVHTWIRAPSGVLEGLATGQIFSTYTAGFFPRHFGESAVGVVALLLGTIGFAYLGRYPRAVGPFVAMAAISLWIALGPDAAGPLAGLPLYDRLLWYRFITPFILAWMLVAGFGVNAVLARTATARRTLRWLGRGALAAGLAWAAAVLIGRSQQIRTESDFPEERAALEQVATWLRDHGDRTGRLYSEFPHWNVRDAISVNYARHLLPVRTGFEELVGWVYENHAAGQVLMARGLIWDNPRPLLDLYATYNVKYAVARSAAFTEQLRVDPRWKLVLEAAPFALFEARYTPTLVEAGHDIPAHVAAAGLAPGGAYDLRLRTRTPAIDALTIKVNASRFWTAHVDGKPVAVDADDWGRLRLAVPALPPGDHEIALRWSMTPLLERGTYISVAALVIAGVALLASRWVRGSPKPSISAPRGTRWVVIGAAGAVLISRATTVDSSSWNAGYRDGMVPSASPGRVRVGSADDDEPSRPNRVLPDAWSAPLLHDGVPAREVLADGRPAFVATLAPLRDATVVITSPSHAAFAVQVIDEQGNVACELSFTSGAAATIPAPCVGAASTTRPGAVRALGFLAEGGVWVTEITVETKITYVEGEALRNRRDDSGADAFCSPGLPFLRPHGGAMMTASVKPTLTPVHFGRTVPTSASGAHRVWVLTGTTPDGKGRATLETLVDGRSLGMLSGDAPSDAPMQLTWKPAGSAPLSTSTDLRFAVHARGAKPSWGDVDLVALVPEP